MRSKTVGKSIVDAHKTPKLSRSVKSKAMAKSPPLSQGKRRVRQTVASLTSQEDVKSKKKSTPTKSSVDARTADPSSNIRSKTPVKNKSSVVKKDVDKTGESSKKVKGAVKKCEKVVSKVIKSSPTKSKLKTKKQGEIKLNGKSKKKVSSQKDVNQFIDIWSIASIGKREASLNATMKVNIMYERQVSPKKSPSTDSSPLKKKSTPAKASESNDCDTKKLGTSMKTNASPSVKKTLNECLKKSKSAESPKRSDSNKGGENKRKRKHHYKIYEDEPTAKSRKKDSEKGLGKAKTKKVVKKRKKNVLSHSLGNIIERSPRQASLNAKAMIAMEQEDDTPVETTARTIVYDWTEIRSCVANDARKMMWVTGSGDPKSRAQTKKVRKSSVSNETILSMKDVVESSDIGENNSNFLQNTLLKAIHEMGDARLLKEFLRSQKEDFAGDVEIEQCPTPEPPLPPQPVKEPSTPSPKKKSTPTKTPETKKTTEKQVKRKTVPSPTKPCRVATPIPQFSPGQQRSSHISSFVPHPAAHSQPIFPNFGDQQQHQKQQPTPSQPIKVTPYAPNSAYVYQCSPANRQQQNIFVPNTPSPMAPFGSDANDLVQRNFPGSFTFNQMGSLSFERRGLNPYQHPHSSAYNPSMHLPIQPIGFNFQQFYQPSIQQLHNQQNLPQSIQQVPLPAHQQYAIVPPSHPLPPPSVLQQTQPLPPAHINPIRPFQPSSYPQYPNSASSATNDVKQDKSCMPPPPTCPVAHSLPQQQSSMTSIVQPLPSYRRAIPVRPQVQSPLKLIKPSLPIALASSSCTTTAAPSSSVSQSFHNTQGPSRHNNIFKPVGSNSVIIHNPLPIRPVATVNASFRPIVSKKENKVTQQKPCDKVSPTETAVESPKKSAVKNGVDESSTMSDILHSAHSTMFSVEEKSTSDSPNYTKQRNPTVTTSSSTPSSKESKLTTLLTSSRNTENFNGAYSVTSILEMPTSKVKAEPKTKSCAMNTENSSCADQKTKVAKKEMYYLCIPPPKNSGKAGTSLLTTTAIPIKDSFPFKLPEDLSIKHFPHSDKVIVIDDDDSSDDEPLAKLVQSKPVAVSNSQLLNVPDKTKKIGTETQKIKKAKINTTALKIKMFEKSDLKVSHLKELNEKLNTKPGKDSKASGKVILLKSKGTKDKSLSSLSLKTKAVKNKNATTAQLKPKQSLPKTPKAKKAYDVNLDTASAITATKDSLKIQEKGEEKKSCDIEAGEPNSVVALQVKKSGPKVTKKAPVRRKSKTQALIPPAVPKTKATHGWSWIGEGDWKMIPKLTQLKEESLRFRKCYTSMKHTFGEVISVKDCVILQSDGDGSVPYVGKVSALWENLNGDMMFSMLWYYQPEHTAAGREPEDGEQELFASKHREENSVACIDDKCYVLMYNEFCRMEADAMRHELGVPTPNSHQMIPPLSEEDRNLLRPLPPPDVGMDNIWFCRYDYDTRKKIVRKPKHKKTDLRYRGPCKLVQ